MQIPVRWSVTLGISLLPVCGLVYGSLLSGTLSFISKTRRGIEKIMKNILELDKQRYSGGGKKNTSFLAILS